MPAHCTNLNLYNDRGMVAGVARLDDDLPSILRQLNEIENKVDRLLHPPERDRGQS